MIPTFEHQWQKIAFIAALCSRHQGNHSIYCETNKKSEHAALYGKILNKVWEYLAGQLKSMKNLENALQQLEDITPEPTEDDGYGVYPALDACLLLTSALQMILDKSIDDVEQAAPLSLATVCQFIEISEGLDKNSDAMAQHPLYQEESQFQQHLTTNLNVANQTQTQVVKQLRRELSEYTYSNLGIAI